MRKSNSFSDLSELSLVATRSLLVKTHRADQRCSFGLEIGCRHQVAGLIKEATKRILKDKNNYFYQWRSHQ